jgi:hypothetical protein
MYVCCITEESHNDSSSSTFVLLLLANCQKFIYIDYMLQGRKENLRIAVRVMDQNECGLRILRYRPVAVRISTITVVCRNFTRPFLTVSLQLDPKGTGIPLVP